MTWVPAPYRVVTRTVETHDTVTLVLRPEGESLPAFHPGQFAMLYAHGVGEVPISVSGIPGDGTLVHTVRAVGAVSRALHDAAPGSVLGARGPFGTAWRLDDVEDLLVVAGGIGLASLRPALSCPSKRTTLLVGARTPQDLLYTNELTHMSDVVLTVDRGDHDWPGRVGFVTEPLASIPLDPGRTTALLCGPRWNGQLPGEVDLVALRRIN